MKWYYKEFTVLSLRHEKAHLCLGIQRCAFNCGGETLQCLTIVDPMDEAIQTAKEALLVFATLGPNETGEVSPEPVPLRIVYRNEKHFSLPKSRRKDDITDTGWLPPCRPIKAVPFRDVWLIGKKELRWLWSHGKE